MIYDKNSLKTRLLCMFNLVNIIAFTLILVNHCDAQVKVGLDNWFNHETNQSTNLPYHYLWTDTTNSGYSQWGRIFQVKGAEISIVERPVKSELTRLNVYIIVDPDTTSENPKPNYILPEDVNAIEQWVKQGGVLAILANNGPNCEFTHLNHLTSRFGITFNHVTLHPVTGNNWEMGASTNLPDHPIFKGVNKIYIKEIASINLKGKAKAILTENGNVLMAECRYGKGYVFAIGDPWIYNEYIDHYYLPADFDNRKAAENLTDYLLKQINKKGAKK